MGSLVSLRNQNVLLSPCHRGAVQGDGRLAWSQVAGSNPSLSSKASPSSTVELPLVLQCSNSASFLSHVSTNISSKTATTRQTQSLVKVATDTSKSPLCLSLSCSPLRADGVRRGCDLQCHAAVPGYSLRKRARACPWQVLRTCTDRAL